MADMHKNMAVALLQPQLNETINAQPRGDKDMISQALTNAMYNSGYGPAHYPVPAIRLEVDICQTWADAVVIFNKDNGVIEYIHGDMS